MNPLNLHFVAQMSVERLLNCVVEGMLIALFAWAALRLMGRRNSGTRFAVWFCALLAIAVAPFVEISSAPAVAQPSTGAAVTMPASWSVYLFGAWAAIATIGFLRVGIGLWHLRGIRKECRPVDTANLDPDVQKTLAEFRAVRPVELCVSDALHVPTAVGFFQPAIALPCWTLQELSPTELNAVILHELAHLRRWDDWTNLAQKLLRALFFFHPAVWFVESRLSLEREMACDDIVLAQTANPRAYAECLVALAEKNLWQRGVALAQAAVGRMRQTSLRILQILDARRSKTISVWKPAPWVVAGFSVACLVGAEHAPRLVAFANPPQASTRVAETNPVDTSAYVPPVTPTSYVAHAEAAHFRTSRPTHNTTTRRANVARRVDEWKADARPFAHQGNVRDQEVAQAPVKAAVNDLNAELPQATSAKLRLTNNSETGDIAVLQQAVFVVMQDNPWGDGPVFWRVSVWRLTVVPHRVPQLAVDSSSKSI